MRRSEVVCRTCGRAWSGRGLRYCGACGDPLAPAPATQAPRRRRATGPLVAGALLGIAATALVVSITGGSGLDTPVASDVDLPDPGEDAPDNALSEAQEETLRRDADLQRLRCEPRGCQLWRRDRAATSEVVAVADLVVVLEGDRLTALDAATGEERWVAPVGRLRSFSRSQGEVRSTSSQARLHPSPGGDGVLLVTRTEVSHVDLEGARTWTRDPDVGEDWDSTVLPHALVIEDRPGRQRPTEMTALDLATGEPTWTVFVSSVHLLEADLIVASGPDRWMRGLDPTDASLLWELGPRAGSWAHSFGPWVAQHGDTGITLLERETGEVVTSFGGYLTSPVVPAGDHWIAVVTGETSGWSIEHPSPYDVLALTSDAEVAWRLTLPRPQGPGCCPLLVSDDGLAVSVLGADGVTTIDVATGQVRDVDVLGEQLVDLLGPGDAGDAGTEPEPGGRGEEGRGEEAPGEEGRGEATTSDGTWQAWRGEGSTLVRSRGGDELAVVTDAGHGRGELDADSEPTTDDGPIVVRGTQLTVESLDPLVVGSPDQLMGLRVAAPQG